MVHRVFHAGSPQSFCMCKHKEMLKYFSGVLSKYTFYFYVQRHTGVHAFTPPVPSTCFFGVVIEVYRPEESGRWGGTTGVLRDASCQSPASQHSIRVNKICFFFFFFSSPSNWLVFQQKSLLAAKWRFFCFGLLNIILSTFMLIFKAV